MACYSPLRGYRARHLTKNGKRPIVFDVARGFADMPVDVPCGKCRGCRLEYSRQWGIRCMHEAQLHDANSFITLTYSNEHLPPNYSVDKSVWVAFMKRFRKAVDTPLRFFMCGEYGEVKQRPHYHAIIFGYDFPDKQLWTIRQGNMLYRSPLLERLWPYGYSLIGSVTFESCAYVARYITKKHIGGDYQKFTYHPETGEALPQTNEFCLMSRGQAAGSHGIGYGWWEKYKSDTNKDYITIRGHKHKIPKYYDNMRELEDELFMMNIKRKRLQAMTKRADDNTPDRLEVRERIKIKQTDRLHRGYENDPENV